VAHHDSNHPYSAHFIHKKQTNEQNNHCTQQTIVIRMIHQTVAFLAVIVLLGVQSFTIAPDFSPRRVSLTLKSTVAYPEDVKTVKSTPEKLTKEAQELLDVLEGKTGFELIVAQTAPSVR
jgi:cell division septal protein FtsQ